MMTGPLLTTAAAGLVAGMIFGPRFSRGWLFFTLVSMGAGIAAVFSVLSGGDWQWVSRFRVGGELLHFRLDAVSAFFVLIVCVVRGPRAIYARDDLPDRR